MAAEPLDEGGRCTAGQAPAVRIDRRRVLMLAGLGAVVVLALVQLAGGRQAIATLLSVPGPLVALMLALLAGAMAVRAWRWQVLVQALGQRVGLGSLAQLLLAGYFLNLVVPARAGDVARVFLLGRWHRVPLDGAAGSLVMERALDVVVNLLGAACAAYLVLPELVPPAVAQLYFWAVLLTLAAVVAVAAAPRLQDRLRRLSSAPRYQAALQAGFGFVGALRQMASDGPRLVLAVGQTALVWGAEIGLAAVALTAVGWPQPLARLAFVVLTVDLVGAIPLLPGALGQVEVAYLSLLVLLGVPKEGAGVAVLLHRTVVFGSIMLVGGLVTLLGGTLRSLRAPADRTR